VREAAWGNGPVDDTGTAPQVDFTRPEPHPQIPITGPDPFDQPSPDRAWLCHPTITGLPATDWDTLITTITSLHDQ
jgi:hypothetical protein